MHSRVAFRSLLLSLLLCLSLFANLLGTWTVPTVQAASVGLHPLHLPPGTQTFKQFVQEGQTQKPRVLVPPSHMPPTPRNPKENTKGQLLPGAETPTMKPLIGTLSSAFLAGAAGAQPVDLKSSDGRLEVQLAPGSFDLTHATVNTGKKTRTAPSQGTPGPKTMPTTTTKRKATPRASGSTKGTPTVPPSAVTPTTTSTTPTTVSLLSFAGPLTLTITEQHGYFVGENVSLGSYQFQFTDAQGHVVSGLTLHTPITIEYHYQPAVMQQFGLDPGQLFLSWPLVAQAAQKAHQSPIAATVVWRNDPKTHTLSAQTTHLGPGPFTVSGDPANLSPPSPLVASVMGNSGQLSYSYPLDTPPGPAGFGPNLSLTYSSETVNERHAYNQPGGDFGDGWSLSPGAITADLHANNSDGGVGPWYNLSGVDGISDRLVQNPNDKTQLLTQHLTYLRIRMRDTLCFQVWDPSGTEYDFGCANGTVQWHKDSTGKVTNYRWDLSKITAPNEGNGTPQKTISFSYLQDCAPTFTDPCPASGNASNGEAIRDDALKQITVYAGSTIVSTTDFFYNGPETINDSGQTWVTPYSNSYYSNCQVQKPTSTRCDDPISYPGGVSAPQVMATLSPSKIISYVGPDRGTGSSPAYEYDFTFTDTTFSSQNPVSPQYACYDPTTQGVQEYCAGEHLLSSIKPIVYQSGTAHTLKSALFHYYQLTDTYSDHSSPDPMPGGAIYRISTGWHYLDYYYDSNLGTGAHVSYERSYSNTHGTPYDSGSSDDRYDPFYCTNHVNAPANLNCDTTSNNPFQFPDDRAWSTQLVTQMTSLNSDSSALSGATTTYAYRLNPLDSTHVCPADTNKDTTCVSDVWGPPTDYDWQDYYDGQYFGMNGVLTLSPANTLTATYYFSTNGLGSPSAQEGNYNSGSPYEEDVYAGGTTSSPLLQQTTTIYTGASNTNSCNPDYDGVYTPCEVIAVSKTTADCEGIAGCSTTASNPTWPQVTVNYTYDDYDTNNGGLQRGKPVYHNLLSEVITSNNAPTVTKKWTYTPDDQTIGTTVFYDVNKVVHSEVEDASGTDWQCQDIAYDEENQSGVASGTPVAGWPTTTTSYSNCADTAHTAIPSYTGYDAYGNPVYTVDGLGATNSALYSSSGCSLPQGTSASIYNGAWAGSTYTTCTSYDTYNGQAFESLPATVSNAFGQTTTTSYDYGQGELPTSSQDPNQQVTTTAYSYDPNSGSNGSHTVQVNEPGECSSPCYTKQGSTSSSCPTSIPSGTIQPCYEIESNTSTYATMLSSTFYDGMGRVVESSVPAPPPASPQSGMSYFTLTATEYNDAANTVWKSVPFVVAVPTANGAPTSAGWLDPNIVTDYTGKQPLGTTSFLDAEGRTIAARDPNYTKGLEPGVACSTTLPGTYTACTNYGVGQVSGDTNYYATTTGVDANGHVGESFGDTLGRAVYSQQFSGRYGGTLTPVAETSVQYNILNKPTKVVQTDLTTSSSVTTTATYDSLGRLTQLVDPDRGTHTYTYDPDGHILTDVSGSRTIGYNYDLLGRVGCVQDAAPTLNATGACTTGTHPYIQNTYDSSNVNWGSTDHTVERLAQSIATTYYPDGNSSTATENFEYDGRGRAVTAQLALTVPSTWGMAALPTYQMATSYNDADQPVTTTTGTITANTLTPDSTTTQVYDAGSGVLNGLGTIANTQTANLASLVYNASALPDTLTLYTTAGQTSPLASEQFSYDYDLRALEATATWQSGSGASGQILDQQRTYDPTGNLVTLGTSLSTVPGQSNSSGTEIQNFCYDEQNRMVWAGNSGTQPSAGSGTCGSGTLASGLHNASYSTSYAYSHLGQLTQGPLNGGSTSYQYLYCNSSAPHQLSGLYPTGTTCANLSGAVYQSSYDAWGNVTSRTENGTTATLSYDLLDHFVKWNAGNSSREWYAYDGSSNRVLRRTINGSSTVVTIFAFGAEYSYNGSGTLKSSTHYYALGGHLIGELLASPAQSTNIFLTDAQGTVLAAFSNTQGSAAVLANQLYGPYGTQRYSGGSMTPYTDKGYTGQYNDALTGLDYYNARYYDPTVGVFLSADTVQGDMQGMNPYAYVGGNPETNSDPTGQMMCSDTCHGGGGSDPTPPSPPSTPTTGGTGTPTPTMQECRIANVCAGRSRPPLTRSDLLAMCATDLACKRWEFNQSLEQTGQFFFQVGLFLLNLGDGLSEAQLAEEVNAEEELTSADMEAAALQENQAIANQLEGDGVLSQEEAANICSFTPTTVVMTSQGEQAIGKVHADEKVLAYNPKTHKMEWQPILHVWIHTDNDLVDLTITAATHAPHSTAVKKTSEVIHTNKKHPFFTLEHGFMPAGQIKLGMHVLGADGQIGSITNWRIVPGVKVMYNLEVSQDHTFTVGAGQWIVHNSCLNPREQYVSDNLDTLIPGNEGNVISGDATPSYNGSHPDFVTSNAIVEVTGADENGNVPADLAQPGSRKWNQLSNFVRGANPNQGVYLLYDGDTSKFSTQLVNWLNKQNITVISFSSS